MNGKASMGQNTFITCYKHILILCLVKGKGELTVFTWFQPGVGNTSSLQIPFFPRVSVQHMVHVSSEQQKGSRRQMQSLSHRRYILYLWITPHTMHLTRTSFSVTLPIMDRLLEEKWGGASQRKGEEPGGGWGELGWEREGTTKERVWKVQ